MAITIARPPLLKAAAIQLVSLVVAGVAVLPLGLVPAYSFFIGGLIQLIGSVYFARLAFRFQGASQVHRTVQAMYRGEMGKIVLSATFFALAYAMVKPLNYVALFVGYIVMVFIHMLMTARALKLRGH